LAFFGCDILSSEVFFVSCCVHFYVRKSPFVLVASARLAYPAKHASVFVEFFLWFYLGAHMAPPMVIRDLVNDITYTTVGRIASRANDSHVAIIIVLEACND